VRGARQLRTTALVRTSRASKVGDAAIADAPRVDGDWGWRSGSGSGAGDGDDNRTGDGAGPAPGATNVSDSGLPPALIMSSACLAIDGGVNFPRAALLHVENPCRKREAHKGMTPSPGARVPEGRELYGLALDRHLGQPSPQPRAKPWTPATRGRLCPQRTTAGKRCLAR
jgi:hypothetical protein